jgi:hypothetical protein
VSNRRKPRQRNGGKLTRDRTEWTHKKRFGGAGASICKPAASRNREAERVQLGGVSARSSSNGVQMVKGGKAADLDKLLNPIPAPFRLVTTDDVQRG